MKNKRVQYLTIDSEFIGPCNNVFTFHVDPKSNIFMQEIKNVIGVKLVDFYVTQIGGTTATKYIDIICNDIPDAGQILDERMSRIFARIPLERDFKNTTIIVNDKQWKSFNRQTNYFNSISIEKLNFQLWEMVGDETDGTKGHYQPLQPDAAFYMILEITTLDGPPTDEQDPLLEAIKRLEPPVVNVAAPNIALPNPVYIIAAIVIFIVFLVMLKN